MLCPLPPTREKWSQLPVSMQSRPEVVYDSPNLGNNITVGGDRRRRWVYLLWSTCPRDKGSLPLIKGDGFQQSIGSRGVVSPALEDSLVFSDALMKIHFIRVSSQVPQGSKSKDNALPSPFGVIERCMHVQLLLCGLNVRFDI